MFGRYLVSLPYLNYGGPIADNTGAAKLLVNRAVELADELAREVSRTAGNAGQSIIRSCPIASRRKCRCGCRCPPASMSCGIARCQSPQPDPQGPKERFECGMGGLAIAVRILCRVSAQHARSWNTRLQSSLFATILATFADRAEICVVRLAKQPVAAALVLHGWNVTEVPSASSLRSSNHTGANMLMYWHLLQRAIERKQRVFDFGRSTALTAAPTASRNNGAQRSWQWNGNITFVMAM